MNKFLKKMLATSATMLVLGQLAPAFSSNVFNAGDFDITAPNRVNNQKALLDKIADLESKMVRAAPSKDVTDYDAALNKAAALQTAVNEALRIKEEKEEAARVALEDYNSFIVPVEPILSAATAPALETDLIKLEEENAARERKSEFKEKYENSPDIDEVKKAYNTTFNAPGDTTDLAGSVDLTGFSDFVEYINSQKFLNDKEIELLNSFTTDKAALEAAITRAKESDTTELNKYNTGKTTFDEAVIEKGRLKTLADDAAKEATDAETAHTTAVVEFDANQAVIDDAGLKAAYETYQLSQFKIADSATALVNKYDEVINEYGAVVKKSIELEEKFNQTLVRSKQIQTTLTSTNKFFKDTFTSAFKYKTLTSHINEGKESDVYAKLEDHFNASGAGKSVVASVVSDASDEMTELRQQLAEAKEKAQRRKEKKQRAIAEAQRKEEEKQRIIAEAERAKEFVVEANQSLSVIEQLANFLNSNEEVKNEVLGHSEGLTELLKKALNIKAVEIPSMGLSPRGEKRSDEENLFFERKNEAEEIQLPSEYAGNFYIGSDGRVHQNSVAANARLILKMKEELRNLNFNVAD